MLKGKARESHIGGKSQPINYMRYEQKFLERDRQAVLRIPCQKLSLRPICTMDVWVIVRMLP